MPFKKKQEQEEVLSSAKRIIFEQLRDDDDRAKDLVVLLKNNHPLVLNFEKLDLMSVNKLLAFFTGATVALDGNIVKINDLSFLFAKKEDFEDGTLNEFLEEM